MSIFFSFKLSAIYQQSKFFLSTSSQVAVGELPATEIAELRAQVRIPLPFSRFD
jgi:hypothetical protein